MMYVPVLPDPLLLNTLSCTLLFVAVSLHKEHCRVHFSMKTSELFDIYDLFELKDFKKVSLSPEATCPQRLPVPRGYLSSKLSTCPQSYPPVHRAMSQDLLAPHRVQQGQEPWYFHRHRMCVLFKHLRPIQFKHLRPILSF